MKTVELKQVNIENYKKFEAAEYQFAPRTMVSGRNRQGKTTLMDAYFDTLTGKLADGTSPNNVRRKEDGEEVEGVVSRELTLLIDGEETVIRKETKKGKSSSTTKYQVDGFDYNQTKYKEFLKGISDSEGKTTLARELKHIIDTHLEVSIKPEKSNNKVSIKALEKFNNLLDEESYK